MRLLATSVLLGLCTGTSAVLRARDDPYATISSLTGVPRPKSTASAIVNAYAQAVQSCGPKVDAALESMIPMYGDATGVDVSEITITDPQFRQWAEQQPTVETANLFCEEAENALFAAEDTAHSSAPHTTTSGITGSGSSPPGDSGASRTGTSTRVTSPAPSASHNGAIEHGYQPLIVATGLVLMFVGLN
ncbi:hypothetical protein B0H15DRAFT_944796 [Mycena belliarum]|uniref:Infection structure specific protein n=1 Tax=Mycena belliarum TaxID=1033014 RepID=A0AAD6UEA8_9AGAR|nr:hypothetical protein B0H15DRAFT_944796 [Mycena belliae]